MTALRRRQSTDKGLSSSYSPTTSNTTLRHHLDKAHKDEYLRISSTQGWKTQLPSLRATSEAPSDSQLGSNVQSRTPFSIKAFRTHLTELIVADDQVGIILHYLCDISDLCYQSMNLLERPEFRRFILLLREDLQDKDIPRRTKIREAIISAWQAYFITLKRDLGVGRLRQIAYYFCSSSLRL